jgi:chaperonin GroES
VRRDFDSKRIKTKTKKEIITMAINVKPLGDRILVEPAEEKEVKKGGIIIPDSAKEKPTEGIVVALGTGKTDDNGKKVPFEVKKGDRVLVSKYGGTEIKLNDKEYKIFSGRHPRDHRITPIRQPLKRKKNIYGSKTTRLRRSRAPGAPQGRQ